MVSLAPAPAVARAISMSLLVSAIAFGLRALRSSALMLFSLIFSFSLLFSYIYLSLFASFPFSTLMAFSILNFLKIFFSF